MTTLRVVAVFLVLLVSPSAHATLIDYSITVSGLFSGNGPNGIPISGLPFGLPLPEDISSLSGTMQLDSSKGLNDSSALVDFQMTTGTRTWTEADVDPNPNTFFVLFQNEVLQSFGFQFRDANADARMDISAIPPSSGYWLVVQSPFVGASYDNARFCNACVSFEANPPASVPEPSTIYLLLCALCAAWVVSLMRNGRKAPVGG